MNMTTPVRDKGATRSIDRLRFLRMTATAVTVAAGSARPELSHASALAAPVTQPEVADLTLWHQFPDFRTALQPVLDTFHRDVPGVRVTQVPKPLETYNQLLNTAMAADALPDLFALNPLLVPTLARYKQLLDLTGKVPNSAKVVPLVRDADVVEHRLRAVSWGRYSLVIYYHRPLFARLNLRPPRDWTEWLAVCRVLKAAGVSPMAMTGDGSLDAVLFTLLATSALGRAGYTALVAGRKKYTAPEIITAMEFLLALTPSFQPGFLATKYIDAKALFARGKVAMIMASSADQAVFRAINPRIAAGVFACPPPKRSGEFITLSGLSSTYGANVTTRYPDAVATFLNWMLSSRGQVRACAALNLLPAVTGIQPAHNSILAQISKMAARDVRVWYQTPLLSPGYLAWTQNAQALYTGRLTPPRLAQLLQTATEQAHASR